MEAEMVLLSETCGPWVNQTRAYSRHRRRRLWRQRFRRVKAASISLIASVGLVLQDVRAQELIFNGPPSRQFVSSRPNWFAETGESVSKWAYRVVSGLRRALDDSNVAGSGVALGGGSPKSWQAADPVGPFSAVNLATGNLFTSVPIVSWDGVSFALFHNGLVNTGVAALGSGWSHSYSARLDVQAVPPILHEDDGTEIAFVGAGPWTNTTLRLTLEQRGGGWLLRDIQQNLRVFDFEGRLSSVEDSSGNATKMLWEEDGAVSRLIAVIDSAKRVLSLEYDDQNRLISLTAPSLSNQLGDENIHRVFELDYSVTGRLERIHSPSRAGDYDHIGNLGLPPRFHVAAAYSNTGHQLKLITDYEGNAWSFFYDAGGPRKLRRVDHPRVQDYCHGVLCSPADVITSRLYTYSSTACPGDAGTEVNGERTDVADITRYCFDAGRISQVIDPLDRVTASYDYEDTNHEYRPTSITNVLGGVTTITYDADGNAVSTTVNRSTGPAVTTSTFDSLNRLRTVTDPLQRLTQYEYEDVNNPMHITRLLGSTGETTAGGAPGGFNQLAFTWGQPDSGHAGQMETMAGPNANYMSMTYDNRGNSSGAKEKTQDTRSGCDVNTSAAVRSATGEAVVTGDRNECNEIVQVFATPVIAGTSASVEELCLDESEGCPVCGCIQTLDESGNVIGLYSDEISGEVGCSVPPDETSASAIAGTPNDVTHCPGGVQFAYDGNQRLICAIDLYQSRQPRSILVNNEDLEANPVRYTLSYDARGRMSDYESLAYEGGPPAQESNVDVPSPTPYVSSYPSYEVQHEYSDTTGRYRVVYRRQPQCRQTDCSTFTSRTITTEYQTDAAGRITSVERDGKVTTHVYDDSTTAPAVIETRPDGSKSLVYLDFDGSVWKVAHESAPPTTTRASFVYMRDALGRITQIDEEIIAPNDPNVPDGMRSSRVEYTYGDGNLAATELDEPRDPNTPRQTPEFDKLYYAFLVDLGGGMALADGDPNRLVRERRSSPADELAGAVQYDRAYRYDQGGNRLAMIEYVPTDREEPESEQVYAVTRYNYFYETIARDDGPYFLPGTPIARDAPLMDYAGRGRNKLLSTQTYYPADPDRVNVVTFEYAKKSDRPERRASPDDDNMIGRTTIEWVRQAVPGDVDHWFKALQRTAGYSYFNGQLEEIAEFEDDYCPLGECETCTPPANNPLACSEFPAVEIRLEFHNFDIFGRRVNRTVCDRWCAINDQGNPLPGCCDASHAFERCKLDHTQYDYDGLSNTVLVERKAPYWQAIDVDFSPDGPDGCPVRPPPNSTNQPYASYGMGDRYLTSYTHGPLGPISRTDEDPGGDTDPGSNPQLGDRDVLNNRDYYYLRDAGGGHVVGLLYDEDNVSTTPATLAGFSVHDAFGNNMSAKLAKTGSFEWRGGEGSVTDRESGLVHMQARHYDPTIGRFIQADTLALASLTTQGTNRFLYTENDPVNGTDPTGRLALLTLFSMLFALVLPFVLAAIVAPGSLTALLGSIARFSISCVLKHFTGLGLLGWIGIFAGLTGASLLLIPLGAGLLPGLALIGIGLLFILVDLARGALMDELLARAEEHSSEEHAVVLHWRNVPMRITLC